MMSNDEVMYVGTATSLRQRWGLSGYGSIQPKNCYVGGQSTNCKINGHVLSRAKTGQHLHLYFLETDDRVGIEPQLISDLSPLWNGRRP